MNAMIDPNFPTCNEDADKLESIKHFPLRPVFIMGLHRSGTTFLYDCVAKCFPVAHLSLYHLLYFDRLLNNEESGADISDKERLNSYFTALGVKDRNIDGTHVDADAVEEYGFLLRKKSGSFKLNADNVPLFSTICRKLLAVNPGKQAVLLKNPWDTGNAEEILSFYPDARFIYISREPISVLNSMLNALLSYLEGPQDYLEILLDDGNGRRSYRKGYAVWVCLKAFRKVLGRQMCARLARGLLAKEVARQVAVYKKEVSTMPPDRAIEIDYESLISDPAQSIRSLEGLLDLPLIGQLDSIEVKQRKNVNPVLRNYSDKLNNLVKHALK
ncbi:sulfotransferase family protein [Zhongshania aliphaticivorans]|nr:sulfotransferase [Zhongshania aliphaticivorans]